MFKIGNRVAYRASFLRSIGDYSYDSASMRGTVVFVDPKPFRSGANQQQYLKIRWDYQDFDAGALSSNLILANQIHLEPV